jgi:hypothetical protein
MDVVTSDGEHVPWDQVTPLIDARIRDVSTCSGVNAECR